MIQSDSLGFPLMLFHIWPFLHLQILVRIKAGVLDSTPASEEGDEKLRLSPSGCYQFSGCFYPFPLPLSIRHIERRGFLNLWIGNKISLHRRFLLCSPATPPPTIPPYSIPQYNSSNHTN